MDASSKFNEKIYYKDLKVGMLFIANRLDVYQPVFVHEIEDYYNSRTYCRARVWVITAFYGYHSGPYHSNRFDIEFNGTNFDDMCYDTYKFTEFVNKRITYKEQKIKNLKDEVGILCGLLSGEKTMPEYKFSKSEVVIKNKHEKLKNVNLDNFFD